MVISEYIKKAERILNNRNEVFILLEEVLRKDKPYILTHLDYLFSSNEEELLNSYTSRRLNREPLQYIINKEYFYGYEFYVDNHVLIPRSDTEILVEKAIDNANNYGATKILDLCTGSGCIPIVLKKKLPNLNIFASDIDIEALSVARKNSMFNNVSINFIKSNLFDNISEKNFDIITVNPPYIESEEIKNLSREVLSEPIIALDGGVDGLDFYREIIKNAVDYLTQNGSIIMEIGYNQGKCVKKILLENNYKEIELIKDYSDNDRVITAKMR